MSTENQTSKFEEACAMSSKYVLLSPHQSNVVDPPKGALPRCGTRFHLGTHSSHTGMGHQPSFLILDNSYRQFDCLSCI